MIRRISCLLFCCFCLFLSSCNKKAADAPAAPADAPAAPADAPAAAVGLADPVGATEKTAKTASLLPYVPNQVAALASFADLSLDQWFERFTAIRAKLWKNQEKRASVSEWLRSLVYEFDKEYFDDNANHPTSIWSDDILREYKDGAFSEQSLRVVVAKLFEELGLDTAHTESVMFLKDSDLVWIAKTGDSKKTLAAIRHLVDSTGLVQELKEAQNNPDSVGDAIAQTVIDTDVKDNYVSYVFHLTQFGFPDVKVIISSVEDRVALVVTGNLQTPWDAYQHPASAPFDAGQIPTQQNDSLAFLHIDSLGIWQAVSSFQSSWLKNDMDISPCHLALKEIAQKIPTLHLGFALQDNTVSLQIDSAVADPETRKELLALQGKDTIPKFDEKELLGLQGKDTMPKSDEMLFGMVFGMVVGVNLNLDKVQQYLSNHKEPFHKFVSTCSPNRLPALLAYEEEVKEFFEPMHGIETFWFALFPFRNSTSAWLHASGHDLKQTMRAVYEAGTGKPLPAGVNTAVDGESKMKWDCSDTECTMFTTEAKDISAEELDLSVIKPSGTVPADSWIDIQFHAKNTPLNNKEPHFLRFVLSGNPDGVRTYIEYQFE